MKLLPPKASKSTIFFHIEDTNLTDKQFINQLLEHNIKIDLKGNHKFRIATHYGFTNNDIEKVIKTIKFVLNK